MNMLFKEHDLKIFSSTLSCLLIFFTFYFEATKWGFFGI